MQNKIKISDQYDLLVILNKENFSKLLQMREEYEKAVKVYEDLQSQSIKDEINRVLLISKNLFPKYDIFPTQFGIRISCKKGISKDGDYAENENSGLGDYDHGQKIYKILVDNLGPILKTNRENIAWFEPEENSDYNEKTSWVYTWIEYDFKKSYLNKKFDFKTAPNSKV